ARCTSTGGNTFDLPSAAARPWPSRTASITSLTALASTVLASVARAASSARSRGTPAPVRMASVEAKRAVSTPRRMRPKSGTPRRRRSSTMRRPGSLSQARAAKKAPTSAARSQMPPTRTNQLRASSRRVGHGSAWRELARELRQRLGEAVAGEDVAAHGGEYFAHSAVIGLLDRRAERLRDGQSGGEEARELPRGERELGLGETAASQGGSLASGGERV